MSLPPTRLTHPLFDLAAELKRRSVLRVAGLYAVVSWVVVQAAATIFPLLHLPEWTATFVLLLLILGFPLALVLAWAFDLTAAGVERTDARPARAATHTGPALRRRVYVAVGVLATTLGLGFFQYLLRPPTEATLSAAPARVARPAPERAAGPPPSAAATTPARPAVAVAAFDALWQDGAATYDGITEDILAALACDGRVVVLPATANPAVPLRATAVLTGSVRSEGGVLRITAQLVDARTGELWWADAFDRPAGDGLGARAAVAAAIARAVELRLAPRVRARP